MAGKDNLRPPWKKGESGNPAGHSQARRFSAALQDAIKTKGLEPLLIQTLLAKAVGDTKALKGRKPEFQWMKEVLDRIDGRTIPAIQSILDEDRDGTGGLTIPDVDDRPEPDD